MENLPSILTPDLGLLFWIGGSAMDAIARQPEATGKIQTNMILTSAFVEGCALFAIAACAFLIK